MPLKRHFAKSTRSNPSGNCLEARVTDVAIVEVRDSKQDGAGPVLRFDGLSWSAFIAGLDSLRTTL